MTRVASIPTQPTNLAAIPRLLAHTQTLGLERWLARPKRGMSTLALSLVWLVLAWRGTGRPERLDQLDERLPAALLGLTRVPTARTLLRSLAYLSAQGLRRAVEASYRAELPRRDGRVWAAIDTHQVPYWGRGKREQFQKGWSGNHSRRLRGYRLFLAVDTDTGQVITFALTRGDTPDDRLLARNLAIGLQIADANARPTSIREPAAFRAAHVDGLGVFARDDQNPRAVLLCRPHLTATETYPLPWTQRIVRLVA